MQTTIVQVTAVKRMLLTLLAIAAVATTGAARQAVTGSARVPVTRSCMAAAPGGKAATIEAADVAVAVQHAASAPGFSTRAGDIPTTATNASPVLTAFAFARPNDPRHLHAFPLLI